MIRRDTANQRSQLSSLVSLANFWSENDEWDKVARKNVPLVSMKIQENSLKNTIERLMRSAHELRTKISCNPVRFDLIVQKTGAMLPIFACF